MSSTAESSTAMNGEQPPSKKQMTKQSPEISIFSLTYDLILNIIARVSRMYYPTLSLVSKKIRSVVASPELVKARSLLNRNNESCLYMCLRYHLDHPRDPTTYWFALCMKPNRTLTDRSSGRLFIPITSPHFDHEQSVDLTATDVSIVTVGSNIYKMGGYTSSSSSEVSVLDCRFNTWHSAPTMRVKRSSPAASVADGKIYVAGGCEDEDSENWVEVFDPKTHTWGNVTNPGTEIRPEEEVKSFGVGGKLYLYGEKPKYVVYDPKEARWNPIGFGMTSAVYFVHGVIGDVMFLWNVDEGGFRWFDFKARSWKSLHGVGDLPDLGGYCKMVDLGGKMAVLWQSYGARVDNVEENIIWCAEIGLERHDGDEMWGNVEWFDVLLTTKRAM